MDEYLNLELEFPKLDKSIWEHNIIKSFANQNHEIISIDSLISNTYENIAIKPFYVAEDIRNFDFVKNQYPGQYPFIRNTHIYTDKSKLFYISREIPANNPKDFNKKALNNISRGQTAIKLMFDDHVNNFPLKSAQDLSIALKDIDISSVPINIEAGEKSIPLFNILNKYCNNNLNTIKGGIDFDPLSILVKKGKSKISLKDSYANMSQMIKNAIGSEYSIIGIRGDLYHESGCNLTQELAFAFATAVEYLRFLLEKGMDIDILAQSIRFHFSVSSDFFMEIAKFRAARAIWAKIIKELDGKRDSQKIKTYAKTTVVNKSNVDPYTNILRNTTEALSAILGGCDTLEVRDCEASYSSINEFLERISRNIPIILAEECNTTEVTDPSGGSYYIETLTNELALQAWNLFRKIEKTGGMYNALRNNIPQNDIQKVVNLRIKNLSLRKDILVGVNQYHFTSGKQYLKQLHIKKNYKIRNPKDKITPLKDFKQTVFFEDLLIKADLYKESNGGAPKVFIAAFGALSKHKNTVDFASDFFSVGGFKSIYEKEYDTINGCAKSFYKSGAMIAAICADDDSVLKLAPEFAKTIKTKIPKAKIYLITTTFKQKDVIYEYIDGFINNNSDMIGILTELHHYLDITP